ncbi:Excinuclease ABC subunit C [Staphylococcus aureus]|uniref:Excinuclease ABC subunit C n=1 Tax=Staphylococcus aureus TaxID=1280 RepID=A0A380DPP8_STAAU|nr:Excinuclease ABC subunit C [Staphylococcus aureus]
MKSILDDIDGIGSKRKTLLLRSFGSIKKMKEATLEDFKNIGIPETSQRTYMNNCINKLLGVRIILMPKIYEIMLQYG